MATTIQHFFSEIDGDIAEGVYEPNEILSIFESDLKELFWFEKNLLKVLPRMQKVSSSKILGNLFADYFFDNNLKIERLEQIFMFFGAIPKANKSNLHEEFLSDIDNIIMETKNDITLRDDGLFWMINKMENFKITSYENLIALAIQLENDEMISLLEQNKISVLPTTYF